MDICLSKESKIVFLVFFCWELKAGPWECIFLENSLFLLSRKEDLNDDLEFEIRTYNEHLS